MSTCSSPVFRAAGEVLGSAMVLSAMTKERVGTLVSTTDSDKLMGLGDRDQVYVVNQIRK